MRAHDRLDTFDPTSHELVFGRLKAHGLHFHIEQVPRARLLCWTTIAFGVKQMRVGKGTLIETKR